MRVFVYKDLDDSLDDSVLILKNFCRRVTVPPHTTGIVQVAEQTPLVPLVAAVQQQSQGDICTYAVESWTTEQ